MAPLTRTRAENQGKVPNELMAEYYAQRAGAGLIITEGTFVSVQGQGWYGAPGVYTAEQARRVEARYRCRSQCRRADLRSTLASGLRLSSVTVSRRAVAARAVGSQSRATDSRQRREDPKRNSARDESSRHQASG